MGGFYPTANNTFMKKSKIIRRLQDAYWTKQFVNIFRKLDPKVKWRGYVVGVNDTFVLLQYLNSDTVTLSGYMVFRIKDIESAYVVGNENFLPRAVASKGMQPQTPLDVIITDFSGVISSVNDHYPLIVIARERKEPKVIYLGRVEQLGKKSVYLRTVDMRGEWVSTHKFAYKDITRIEFGDGYSEALWRATQARNKR
jgi:hypothetical protein